MTIVFFPHKKKKDPKSNVIFDFLRFENVTFVKKMAIIFLFLNGRPIAKIAYFLNFS